jgi:hypothetical protein
MMQSGLFGNGLWGFVVVVGPILLAAAIAWAILHNRRSRSQIARTEQATRDLYDGDPVDRTKS